MRMLSLAWKGTGLLLVISAMAGTASAGATPPVPEIDPGSILSAMTLLGCGLMMVTERRRNK